MCCFTNPPGTMVPRQELICCANVRCCLVTSTKSTCAVNSIHILRSFEVSKHLLHVYNIDYRLYAPIYIDIYTLYIIPPGICRIFGVPSHSWGSSAGWDHVLHASHQLVVPLAPWLHCHAWEIVGRRTSFYNKLSKVEHLVTRSL